MPSLGKREKCPIHGSYFCCGRVSRERRIATKKSHRTIRKPGSRKGWVKVANGVWRIDDETHPRKYRERRNKTAMTDLLIRKVREQNCTCALCGDPFDDFNNVAPDHVDPRGAGGQWRDDHPSNIQAVHHHPCNVYKGSRRDIENVQKELREIAK